MPREKKTKAEKEQEKLERQQRALARKHSREEKKKIQEEKQNAEKLKNKLREEKLQKLRALSSGSDSGEPNFLVSKVPNDVISLIVTYLTSKDCAALSLVCSSFNHNLKKDWRKRHFETRVSSLLSSTEFKLQKDFLENEKSPGGTNTCRVIDGFLEDIQQNQVKQYKNKKLNNAFEEFYPTFARFVEEAFGYSTLSVVDEESREIRLPELSQGKFVSCSPEHSLIRSGGGSYMGGGSGVTAFGVGKRGQLGNGERNSSGSPLRLRGGIGYDKIRIVQVSAGGGLVRIAHSLLLTSNGKVLSFGTAMYGQLGHGYSPGKQLKDELKPRYIEALMPYTVTCVSAGELHSSAVTSDGDLYTWGDGFCGQLGHGNKRPYLVPKQVCEGGIEDEVLMSVSCGNRHTLCVTDEGELWTFGLGDKGCLGRDFTPFQYDQGEEEGRHPIAPTSDMDDIISQLEIMANSTLDDNSTQCIPQVVSSLSGVKITGACAGHNHSMALDSNGHLYTFGNGSAGALGHGDFDQCGIPLKISEFVENDVFISQMSAGVDFSMAVCSKGNVYSWGKHRGNRLGHPTNNGYRDREYITTPRKIIDFPTKAIDVECGYVHSLIVGLDGSVYMCGLIDGFDSPNNTKNGKLIEELADLNIWQRLPEPKSNDDATKNGAKKWVKYGKYEVKGRTKMMEEAKKWS